MKPDRSGARRAALISGPIVPALVKLAVPIVLANVMQAGYQLTDAFWVGRLGGAAVAAVAVSFPIMFFVVSAGAGLAVAGSTMAAQFSGAGNERMVNRVAGQTLLMVLAVSMILTPAAYFLAPWVLYRMGVSEDVYVGALPFFQTSMLGLPFVFLFMMAQAILRGIGEVRLPLLIVFVTVVLNFALDPLFIFGWGPLAGRGVQGAAVATVLTQGLSAIAGVAILFIGGFGIQLRVRDFVPDWALLRKAIWLGLPASVEQSARALGLVFMTFLIARFGTASMAAFGIGGNLLRLIIIPGMGVSMAAATMVGQNIGARQVNRAWRVAHLSAAVAFLTLGAVGVAFYVWAAQLVAFFVPDDPAVVVIGAALVRYMSLAFGFVGLQLALTGAFRGAGDMIAPLALVLVSQWGLQLPLAYVLSRHTTLGVEGVWMAFPLSNVLISLLATAWFVTGRWVKPPLTGDALLAEQVAKEILVEEGIQTT